MAPKQKGSPIDGLPSGYRSSATALLITILRTVAIERDGPIWSATLINALALCGILERNARQTILRIAERGTIKSEKVGARTRWHITEYGHELLASAHKRAVDFGVVQEHWDEQWLVVIAPVSEDQREKRRLLRSHLAFHGFGFVGNGVAVSTHVEREARLTSVLTSFDIGDTTMVFRGSTGDVLPDSRLLERAWDLEGLATEYDAFLTEFEQVPASSDQEKFAAYIALEHAWFHFAFIDPELPRRLLPLPWIGESAKALYDKRSKEWRYRARRWFDETDRRIEA